MEFLNIWAFFGFLFIPLFFIIKNKNLPFKKEVLEKIVFLERFNKKKRFFIYLTAYIFLIFALSRPIIKGQEEKIKVNSPNVIILLSGGKEMKHNDIYPNRFVAAIEKLKKLFKYFNNQHVSLILVLDQSYLVSPFTTDYDSIIYLLKHIDKKRLFKTKANFKLAFKNANALSKNKIIITITDKFFNNGISYIFAKNKVVQKGIHFTYSDEDIKLIAKKVKMYNKSKEVTIKNNKELFYYPLFLAIILFFIGGISIRKIQ
ncbi:hypothetical protein JCM11957_17730 [Caminibacter profundus]